ncbi:receptor-like protein 46 [Quercus robur]|uniref:receptor-like protein 46 n=1 Tax=Quercus robur TaxID=38942 RepID=UPI0021625465|nr:receptor-like protein 46 [Quercus robur]
MFGNLVGMIEKLNKSSSFLSFSIGVNTPAGSSPSIRFNDLLVNWKGSIRGLSSRNLDLYTLLDLSMNQLFGEIPASLGTLKALKTLNISHNNIFGKVPTSLGDLVDIESLDLSHNKLWGSIPQSLEKLQQLEILDVSNNNLTGKIRIGGQMFTMNDPNSYANNNGLCEMQIQDLCPEDLPPTNLPKDESKETWFKWEGVWIGYLVGFFVIVGSLYINGYFVLVPSTRRRQHIQQTK